MIDNRRHGRRRCGAVFLGAWRVKIGILAEDRRLHVSEGRRGIEAELFGKERATLPATVGGDPCLPGGHAYYKKRQVIAVFN